LDIGAAHVTTDWAFAFDVPDTALGGLGRPTGTTAADTVNASPVPAEFVAVTVNV
jgi:hypothetical protein